METSSIPQLPSCSCLRIPNYSTFPAKNHLRNIHQPTQSHQFKIKSSTVSRQRRIPATTKNYPSPSTSSSLVKQGSFIGDNELPSSIPLHKKNPNAIYKDVQSLARRNNLKAALAILDYLEKQDIPVNATTFSSLIAACIRSKSLIFAKEIHHHIRANGLQNNEFLTTKLIQMYASCGSFDDAESVFNDRTQSTRDDNVYPWNALLRGNVVQGRRKYREILELFYRMRELGVELNEYSYSCLIKSFAGGVAFRQGLKIHALLIKNAYIDSSILRTSLIDLYFKCGKINLARHLFDEMPEKDIVVWGAMIAGFAHNGLRKEALRCFRWLTMEGIDPNSVVLTTILPIIGELGAWQSGKEIHGYVIKKRSYMSQVFIHSALIDMYCKCGDVDSGCKVFDSVNGRNTISWTALISGYISNGMLGQVLKSIIMMQQQGFKPDVVTVATVLPVCAKLKALTQGKELHAYLLRNEMLPNVSLITSLIVMYSKCGILEYSLRLFDGMQRRNVISWTAMMDSFMENGCLWEALDVFRTAQLSRNRPDSIAVSRILSVCGELQVLKLGKEVHAQVFKKDLESIPHIAAETIKMYGKCGAIDKAKSVSDMIQIQGSLTQSAMIEVYGYNGQFRDAMNVFDLMVNNGFHPSHITFSIVLSICDRAGYGDEAQMVFRLMTKKFEIEASMEHYDTIIRLLTRLGRVDEAAEYIHCRAFSAS